LPFAPQIATEFAAADVSFDKDVRAYGSRPMLTRFKSKKKLVTSLRRRKKPDVDMSGVSEGVVLERNPQEITLTCVSKTDQLICLRAFQTSSQGH
jgi:hypothetical protein